MHVLWLVENVEPQNSKKFYLILYFSFSTSKKPIPTHNLHQKSQLPRKAHNPRPFFKPLNPLPLQTYSPLSLSLISLNMYGLQWHHTRTQLSLSLCQSLPEEEHISSTFAHQTCFSFPRKDVWWTIRDKRCGCGLCAFLLKI